MKLWLISQDVNKDYDTFDCAVVSAETEEEARNIHPSDYYDPKDTDPYQLSDWCEFDKVHVSYIGIAKEGTKKGVICASFNAG